MIRYGSVCSGIEAVTAAWHELGAFSPQWFAEIATFPSSVLAHRWPSVLNVGDFTKIEATHGTVDLLVGGTPCQSFSESGLRDGLDDPRGHLTIEFLRLARRLRPRWVVWENVPGVLHHEGGETFETVLRLLGECGYGWAYRVLDAQYFGVPQRRRRVFVVGYLGDWRPASAVLFERPSMHRDPRSRSKAGTSIARAPAGSTRGGEQQDWPGDDVAHTLRTAGRSADLNQTIAATVQSGHGRNSPEDNYVVANTLSARHHGHGIEDTFVTHALTTSQGRLGGSSDQTYIASDLEAEEYEDDGGELEEAARCLTARKGRDSASSDQTFALGFHCTQDPISFEEGTPALTREHSGPLAVLPMDTGVFAYDRAQITHPDNRSNPATDAPTPTLSKTSQLHVAGRLRPRRLTPRECERLMGFPDDYTKVPGSSDSSRYEALGNSMALPVVRWIGERILAVEKIMNSLASGK